MWLINNFRNNAKRFLLLGLLCALICLFTNSIAFCRFTVFIIVITCLGFGIQEDKVVNPYYLFILTPITLLIFFDLGGSYFMKLEVRTWNLAIINMLAFVVVLKYTPDFRYINRKLADITGRSAYIHLFILYILSLLAPFAGPFYSVLSLLSSIVIVLAFSTRNKLLILLYTILVVVNMAVGAASKSGVLTVLIAYLVSYEKYYVSKQQQRIKTILLSLCAVVVMAYAFSFATKGRGRYNAEDGLAYYTRDGLDWHMDASLFMPYMYLETPWINLQYVIDTQDNRTYGLWAAKPILGYLGLNDDSAYKLVPYSSFNTFTFISCQFKDFGYYGSVLLSLFLGFFVKKVYSLSRQSSSPFVLGCYVLVAQATLEMFFSNHFFMQSYPFTICIMMWLYQKLFVYK